MDYSISAARRFPVVCADFFQLSHAGPGNTLRSRLPRAKFTILVGLRFSKTRQVAVLWRF